MPILNILTEENPKLREKSQEIENVFDNGVKKIARNMIKTMKNNNGIGLAAPQVGELVRLIVIEIKDGPLVLINPKILKYSKDMDVDEEGCLSVPGRYGNVKRPIWVEYEGTLVSGKKVKEKAKGLLARVIQHEIDHLDGILFIDKLADEKK